MSKTGQIPPKFAERFLLLFLKDDLAEEVLGDLDEKFYKSLDTKSLSKAKINYWYQVINYLRPFALKNYWSNSTYYIMYQHNLKIAYRHLLKDKGYSFINIFSLAVGIAACMVIYLFITDERSFDSWHSKKENIYRLDEIQNFTGTKEQKVALSMPGMGPNMQKDFPEVLEYTRYWPISKSYLSKKEVGHTIEGLFAVDSTFLKLFDYPLIQGDRNTALDEPNSILLTEKTALKFFETIEEAFGNTLKKEELDLKITGILKDVPENSHLQFDLLFSLSTFTDNMTEFNNQFGSNYVNTYLLLEDNVDVSALEAKFDDFMIEKTGNENVTDIYSLFLQQLDEVHLASSDIEHDYNNYRKFNGKYLSTFGLIGIFVLIIAGINFMNISIARSSQRWKEIGVRKASGAKKTQLFNQFIFESVLMALIALVLALLINYISLPLLNNLIGRKLSLSYFIENPAYIGLMFSITVVLGILAGLYPSLHMTSFEVSKTFKGNQKEGKSVFRSALVILQFGLALAMIVSTLIVLRQLNFMKNKDIGFEKDQIVLIDMNDQANEKFEILKNEFLGLSSVSGVTASGQRIGNNFHQWGFQVKNDTGIYNLTPSNVHVDYDYLDVYNIKLKDGRTFSKDIASDKGRAFIINEALAKEIGVENPVGTPAGHGWYDTLGTIIGVTEDFNFNSLHHKVNTLAMVVHEGWGYNEMSIKIEGDNMRSTLDKVEAIWNQHIDNWPFDYEFLDQHFETLYESDNQMSSVVSIMTVLAILIACMGLFALSSILVMQKIKEVGIRKVLGASTIQITYLLSKNFLLLVLVAFLIASPITYYFLENWLENFAFRVNIGLGIFIIGGILSLLIAALTVGFHTLRASLRNPVDALRYE